MQPSMCHNQFVTEQGSTLNRAHACAGLFSLWACKGGGGGRPARVLAVEPMPPNLALLRRNLREHGLNQQARCGWAHMFCEMVAT